MWLTLSENGVKSAVQLTINSTAAWTSFQDSLIYATFLFSEWRIGYVTVAVSKII